MASPDSVFAVVFSVSVVTLAVSDEKNLFKAAWAAAFCAFFLLDPIPSQVCPFHSTERKYL